MADDLPEVAVDLGDTKPVKEAGSKSWSADLPNKPAGMGPLNDEEED